MTHDYDVTLRDGAGRTAILFITGWEIDEALARGDSIGIARENVEGNQFQNAISRGEIGDDAWIVADSFVEPLPIEQDDESSSQPDSPEQEAISAQMDAIAAALDARLPLGFDPRQRLIPATWEKMGRK